MKFLRILCIVFFASNLFAQTNAPQSPPAADYKTPIQDVIKQLELAVKQSTSIIQPTKHDIFVAKIDKLPPPQPQRAVSLSKLSFLCSGVDTSQCPDDFKAAWKNFITSLTLSDKLTPTEKGQMIKDFGEMLIVPHAGVVATAGDLEKDSGKKEAVKSAQMNALLQLRLVCSSYGVK